ncbi:hypothetical protein WICPIJ_009529 [Wickerhamomyces pijperi]|uniref:Uncharacterized protein n=1 Tax=Wickerhamomyces pijperi TaxID=599730 RepID=A0A9P8TDR0_WICPI|nr:hypothetical protein WICPIJ_009529 [Wickerhamomyces pijperi]
MYWIFTVSLSSLWRDLDPSSANVMDSTTRLTVTLALVSLTVALTTTNSQAFKVKLNASEEDSEKGWAFLTKSMVTVPLKLCFLWSIERSRS